MLYSAPVSLGGVNLWVVFCVKHFNTVVVTPPPKKKKKRKKKEKSWFNNIIEDGSLFSALI